MSIIVNDSSLEIFTKPQILYLSDCQYWYVIRAIANLADNYTDKLTCIIFLAFKIYINTIQS